MHIVYFQILNLSHNLYWPVSPLVVVHLSADEAAEGGAHGGTLVGHLRQPPRKQVNVPVITVKCDFIKHLLDLCSGYYHTLSFIGGSYFTRK